MVPNTGDHARRLAASGTEASRLDAAGLDPSAAEKRRVTVAASDAVNCLRSCIAAAWDAAPTAGPAQESVLLLDCVEVCQLTANALRRDSPEAPRIAALCATICRACAERYVDCPSDVLRNCADACRRCALSCGDIAQAPRRLQVAGYE